MSDMRATHTKRTVDEILKQVLLIKQDVDVIKLRITAQDIQNKVEREKLTNLSDRLTK